MLTSTVLTGANFNELIALPSSERNQTVAAPGPTVVAAFTRESLRLHSIGASHGKHADAIGQQAITPTKAGQSQLVVLGSNVFGQSGLALAQSGRSPPLSKI